MGKTGIASRVVRLFPPHEVVLNKGRSDGVRVGDRVTVFREWQVADPVTQADLGILKRPVLDLEVSRSEDQFSVAETIEAVTREGGRGAVADAFFYTSGPARIRVTDELSLEDWRTVLVPSAAEATIIISAGEPWITGSGPERRISVEQGKAILHRLGLPTDWTEGEWAQQASSDYIYSSAEEFEAWARRAATKRGIDIT